MKAKLDAAEEQIAALEGQVAELVQRPASGEGEGAAEGGTNAESAALRARVAELERELAARGMREERGVSSVNFIH